MKNYMPQEPMPKILLVKVASASWKVDTYIELTQGSIANEKHVHFIFENNSAHCLPFKGNVIRLDNSYT